MYTPTVLAGVLLTLSSFIVPIIYKQAAPHTLQRVPPTPTNSTLHRTTRARGAPPDYLHSRLSARVLLNTSVPNSEQNWSVSLVANLTDTVQTLSNSTRTFEELWKASQRSVENLTKIVENLTESVETLVNSKQALEYTLSECKRDLDECTIEKNQLSTRLDDCETGWKICTDNTISAQSHLQQLQSNYSRREAASSQTLREFEDALNTRDRRVRELEGALNARDRAGMLQMFLCILFGFAIAALLFMYLHTRTPYVRNCFQSIRNRARKPAITSNEQLPLLGWVQQSGIRILRSGDANYSRQILYPTNDYSPVCLVVAHVYNRFDDTTREVKNILRDVDPDSLSHVVLALLFKWEAQKTMAEAQPRYADFREHLHDNVALVRDASGGDGTHQQHQHQHPLLLQDALHPVWERLQRMEQQCYGAAFRKWVLSLEDEYTS